MKKLIKFFSYSFLLLVFFISTIGIVFLVIDQPLPEGEQGEAADQLATKMRDALSYEALKDTSKLQWIFRGKRHYQWHKGDSQCTVKWDNIQVDLDLKNQKASKVFIDTKPHRGKEKSNYIEKALKYFNNDSFWLIAPFKVFDSGVERRLVKGKEGKMSLLVTYTSGGNTPGDSYLWHIDEHGIPTSFQMWVSLIPIGGLSATWENWITTKSGIRLASLHQVNFLDIELTNITGMK